MFETTWEAMKQLSLGEEQEKLGEIFKKLNSGVGIKYLSMKEQEFLCSYYGEHWVFNVESLIGTGSFKIKK